MLQNGAVASFGNTGGAELHISVYPFILRGVRLIGIDSAATLMPLREKIWRRLAGELRPKMLGSVARTVAFSELPEVFQGMIRGQSRGRAVVKIG
jgi:NADPH:quinone reductase-like Zn-dependent oxidoreductase